MDLKERCLETLRVLDARPLPDLSPSMLCRAVSRALGADGAGLLMSPTNLRLPVGASSEAARTAEELAAALGEGPSLAAETAGTSVPADEPWLATRWPRYYRALTDRTGFRSAASFPLRRTDDQIFATLTVCWTRPEGPDPDDLDGVESEIGDLVADLLLSGLPFGDEGQDDESHPGRRNRVWVAVGMVREAAGNSDEEALALLRGVCFRTDLLIDEVADRMLDGRMTTGDVIGIDRT